MFRRIDRIEKSLERLEERLDSFIDSPSKLAFTTVKIKYKDKKKGLIFCNRCSGTGKEDSRYGGKRSCILCDGKGYLKLRAV